MRLSGFHLDILPAAQRALWPELVQFRDAFVLYGGTAIALQLGHRQSLDFDFFTSRAFRSGTLLSQFALLRGVETLQASPNTLTVLKSADRGEVKLSFLGGLDLMRVRPPVVSPDNELRVASLLDLAGTKIKVLQDRAELKDYLDIVAIIESGIGIADAVCAAMAIYGKTFNAMPSLKALTYFEDVAIAPLNKTARQVLQNAVKAVDLGDLQPRVPHPVPLDSADDRLLASAPQSKS